MNHGLVQRTVVCKSKAENLMRHRIVRVVLENVAKENVSIVPTAQLNAREDGEHKKDADRESTQQTLPEGAVCRPIGGPPGKHHKDSHQGDIGVAVRHGLTALLNQANHRYQRAEIPEPAYGEEWLALDS